MLRHKTASITLDNYGHLYDDDLQAWQTGLPLDVSHHSAIQR
jgi:hypothetical protein